MFYKKMSYNVSWCILYLFFVIKKIYGGLIKYVIMNKVFGDVMIKINV